jgi:hypothetical protein
MLKPLFKCELHYFPSPHLSQVYDGFEKLRRLGILDVSIKPTAGNKNLPLLTVILNNKYKIIYDTLDGLNWIDGSMNENLNHFKKMLLQIFTLKEAIKNLFLSILLLIVLFIHWDSITILNQKIILLLT